VDRGRLLTKCPYARADDPARERVTGGRDPQINGWVESAQTFATGPVKTFISWFLVPQAPINTGGSQTIYLFPGLQSTSSGEILQPVLAWNGFNDHRWTMTNWRYSTTSGNTIHDNPRAVNVGDQIEAAMMGSGCSGNVCPTWVVYFSAPEGNQALYTDSQGAPLDWVIGAALEVYGVNNCTDLPGATRPNGTFFENGFVQTMSGSYVYPSYDIRYANTTNPSCAYQAFAANRGQSNNVTWLFWSP
jgi:hypothetical protein